MLKEAVVSRSITVLGQPFGETVMFGRPANRVFRVVDGASLDLRFVTLLYGYPEIITPTLIVGSGSALLVEGGQGKVSRGIPSPKLHNYQLASVIDTSEANYSMSWK